MTKIEIQHALLRDILRKEDTLNQLKKLTIKPRKQSILWNWLNAPKKTGAVHLAYFNDEIVGWCLVHKWWNTKKINVFVHSKYRNQGIGKQLVLAAKKKARVKVLVGQPWHDASYTLFIKTGIEIR